MLAAGRTLGNYRVLAPLGAGGMGEVYRAHDPRLERDIALKVLPDSLTADPTARTRLIGEARAAAALSHPNICVVHEVGEADGRVYIAMELVEGEPLSERIGGKPLPAENVVRYGAQIAQALAHAHERHVIHRDLKSGNVMVTADGRVKVLDFGVAKRAWVDKRALTQPQVTLTETGAVVGTPYYLAPEVLHGGKADAVSEVWALGVLLYEMAAGRMPFTGATTPELYAAILNEQMAPLPESAPAGLRSVIQRCLAKEPRQRFHSAAEVRAALEALQSDHFVPGAMATPGLRRRMVKPGLALVVVVLASCAGWLLWKRFSQPSPSAGIDSHGWRQLTFVGTAGGGAISPDGRTIAYVVAGSRVVVQDVVGGQALEVFKSDWVGTLQWSPTGSDILVSGRASNTRGRWLVPRMGGQARSLSFRGFYASLSSDGTSLAEAETFDRRILVTGLAGGDTSWINLSARFTWLHHVDWSPDDRTLLVCVGDETGSSVWTMRRDGSSQQMVYETAAAIRNAYWAPRGDAIYCIRTLGHRGELVKVYVNRDGTRSRRPARVLISEPGLGEDRGAFGLSSDGRRLVCARAVRYANLWVWELARSRARGTMPRQSTEGTANDVSPTLSPDGERVAFLSNRGGAYNVHVLSLPGGETRQLTFMEQEVYSLAWSPDGRSIAFTAPEGDTVRVWQIAVDGGTPKQFKHTQVSRDTPSLAWWPGSKLLYESPGNRNFNVLDPITGAEHPLVQDDSLGWMFQPAWSPDGEHVAVRWNRRDRPRGLWIVSAEDSAQHFLPSFPYTPSSSETYRWAHDGRALHYVPRQPPWRLARVSFPQGDTTTLIWAPFEKLNEDEAWMDLDFTPDLRRFVYAAGERKSDIWLLEDFDQEVK